MTKVFESVLPNGSKLCAYPLSPHGKLAGVKLTNPDEVIVNMSKIFVIFSNKTHETGMLSLIKPAGFTITADRNPVIGVTKQDIVDQVPKIVKIIFNNPDIYGLCDWSSYDRLMIESIWCSTTGHYSMFISETYGEKYN